MNRSWSSTDRPLVVNTLLLVVLIGLVNIGLARVPLRIDLTRSREYSLTNLTREVLLQATQPIRVRMFFSTDLPQPYDAATGYFVDLLREYRREARDRFSMELLDVRDPQVVAQARALGIAPREIQQIRSDQYQSRTVYMAAAVEYAGLIEIINPVTEENATEYRLTDSIARLITRRARYASEPDGLAVRFMFSPSLESLGVRSLSPMKATVDETLRSLSTATGLRYTYDVESVSDPNLVDRYARTYGLPRIRWNDAGGNAAAGLLAVVVSDGDAVEMVPIAVRRDDQGAIQTEAAGSVRRRLVRALDIVTGVLPTVGYVTGHGEPPLDDVETGAAAFAAVISPRFALVEMPIEDDDVPSSLAALIITSPLDDWSRRAADRLETFLETGGHVLAMVDPVVLAESGSGSAAASWRRTSPALREVFVSRGIAITDEIVLDERSFVARRDGIQRQLFQAPVIQGRDVNQTHPVTSGIDAVTLFNPAALELPASSWTTTILLQSSRNSWTNGDPETIGPWIEAPPSTAVFRSRPLAVVAEQRPGDPREGRLIVLGTSALTASPMLTGTERASNRIFVENMVDFTAGRDAFATLRTKGLDEPHLDPTTPGTRTTLRVVSIAGPILMFGFTAGVVFLFRRRRRATIRRLYGDES